MYGQKNKEQFPSLGKIVFKSMLLASQTQDKLMLAEADYFIRFNMIQLGFLDFKPVDKLVELGYQEAMKTFTGETLNKLKG